MDFVNSFDLDSANEKCNRVRSWYLYEQYRSLEKNQLDAAERLKKKSYQDKILKQELSERRARRRLCNQFGLCQSESRLSRSVRSVPSNVYLNDDDLYESFSELHDEYELENYEDNNSHDSETSKEMEDFTNVDTKQPCTASVNGVVEDVKIDKMDNDIMEELETVKKNIAENITLQLDTVKENIECLEKYAKLYDDEEISDVDDAILNIPMESDVHDLTPYKLKNKNHDNSMLKMWSNFVHFAYKMINVNHGNCYYDYSSQILTAVLACDVLLRGVSRMCNILQTYVSPIKYASSDSETSLVNNKKTKRKKSVHYDKINKSNCTTEQYLTNNKHSKRLRNFNKKYHSDCERYNCCKNSFENFINEVKHRGTSEPLRITSKFKNCKKYNDKSHNKISGHFVRDKFSNVNTCKCRRLKSSINPILQLVRYIEILLQDITDL